MAYEQKPNTFALFKDTDDRIDERKKYYREKGWDENAVSTYSGKFVLEDGSELGIEARVVDGAKGKFFAGRAWKKKTDAAPSQNAAQSRTPVDLNDDIPF